MHRAALLLASSLLLALPAAAQKDKQSYCDFEKAPNKDGCIDIKDNGIKDGNYYYDEEWWSGNCRVSITQSVGVSGSITGGEVKEAIQNALDNCDSGFVYTSGILVETNLCTLEMSGVKTECSSPLQKVRGLPGKSKTKREPSLPRRHLTDVGGTKSQNPNHLFSRQTQEPFPGIICGGGPGSAKISDCMDLSREIRESGELQLPYLGGNGDCQLIVYATSIHGAFLDKRAIGDTSHIAYSMEEDLEICADSTNTYVGWISNYLAQDIGYDYHFFFGRACGAFGQGAGDGCFNG